MSDPNLNDVHAHYVRELVETDDWAALVRYWMAHGLHEPALDGAVEVVNRRAASEGKVQGWVLRLCLWLSELMGMRRTGSTPPWRKLGTFLEDIRRQPLVLMRHAPAVLVEGWEGVEKRTLFLLVVFPYASLCEQGARVAAEYEEEEETRKLLSLGVKNAELALESARAIQDTAAEAFFCVLLSNGQRHLGNLEASRTSMEKARTCYQELIHRRPDVYKPYLARALNNLGLIQETLDYPELALSSIQEALAILRDLEQSEPDAYSLQMAQTLDSLGLVQMALGEPNAACFSLWEALDRFCNMGASEFHLARTYNNLGNAQNHVPDPVAANQSYHAALARYLELEREQPDVYRANVADVFNNLGTIQRDRGELEAAHSSYREALDRYRRLARYNPDIYKPNVSVTLNNLGMVQRDQDDLQAAFDSFAEATQLFNDAAVQYPTSQLVQRRQAWANLARLYLRHHPRFKWPDRQRARAAFREALKCAEAFGGHFRDLRHRHRVQEESLYVYEGLVQTCVDIAQHDGDRAALNEAVTVAEASRARYLKELLTDVELQPASAPPDFDIEGFHSLRKRLRQIERCLQRGETRPQSDALVRLHQEAENLRHEHKCRLDDICRYDGTFDPDQPVPLLSLDEMRTLLLADVPTAAVLYTITKERGLALLVTAHHIQAVTLPDLNDRQAWELANAWTVAYRFYANRENRRNTHRFEGANEWFDETIGHLEKDSPGSAKVVRNVTATHEAWDTALDALLQPVAERAVLPILDALAGRGIKRLVLVPNRALHVFPLHACRLPDGCYLSDTREVVYTPSLSILHRCASRRHNERSKLCLVENPTCDSDLPFTEWEGTRLRERYRSPEPDWPKLLYGGGATKDEFLQNSRECHVLAYTGHSGFDAADPLNSALVLGSDRNRNLWLTLRDIFTGLHLRQNLLTIINGCESGMVMPDRLDEYVGLPSGFLYAGAA
jgi:tetratricopeptide (TPR) repeat protein